MANEWDPQAYARHGRFVSDLGGAALALLGDVQGKRVLDAGCGDGALSLKLAEAGAEVVGVDVSEPMVTAAQARGLNARVADLRALEFAAEFDAVFSNAVLHWNHPLEDALHSIHRALRPEGVFVAECGGFGNIGAVSSTLRAVMAGMDLSVSESDAPAYLGVEEMTERLNRAGFGVESIQLVPRPTRLPGPLRDWLLTFRRTVLEEFEPDVRGEILDRCEAALAPSLRDRDGVWWADYVRLRFLARRGS